MYIVSLPSETVAEGTHYSEHEGPAINEALVPGEVCL